MAAGAKPKQPGIDRKRSLDGVPVVNPGVVVDDADPERLVVTVKLQRGRGLLARFQPPVMERRVRLDALGSFVFAQIDGVRPVRRILDMFEARYRVNRREAELSCVAFLKSLAGRQVISIIIK